MALQDISAGLNWPAQRTDGVTTESDKFGLMIEMFNNVVRSRTFKAALTDGVITRHSLTNTDTMSNAAHTDPTLQAVVAGVEPEGKTVLQGDSIVQVKTPIIARVTEAMLPKVQDRLNIYGRMPAAFSKILAKAIDEIQFHKMVQAGLATVGAGGLTALPSGKKTELAAANDELDGVKMEKAIRDVNVAKMKEEIETEDGLFYVNPDVYGGLLDAEKLISSLYSSANGSFAGFDVMKAGGFKIAPTNRLPSTVNASHIMGAAYNISAEEATTVACWGGAEAVMSAESIPLTADAYFDQRLLTYFVDAYIAFGSAVDNPAYSSTILSYTA